jgi:pilus assembly protein FimV
MDAGETSISTEQQTDDSNELDISFGDTPAEGEEDILDVSIAQVSEDSNELDISFGDTPAEGEGDILDISIAQVSDDSNELDLSLGDASGEGEEDLLDVTSAINFEGEGEDNLLDVTTTADEDVDADVDTGTGTSAEFDLDLGGESPEISPEDELVGDTGDEADAGGLDFDIGTVDANEPVELDMEIDSTVEMPPESIEPLSMAEDADSSDMEATVQMSPTLARALITDDEDEDEEDDDDKTFLVPKSLDIEEQTEDDEMASQLDLAKAYIELGDSENAKTILDEIMAQGSENYRKQAEELIGQIN